MDRELYESIVDNNRRKFSDGVSFGSGVIAAIKQELSGDASFEEIKLIFNDILKFTRANNKEYTCAEELRNKLNLSVEMLALNVRGSNGLCCEGVDKIGHLVQMNEKDFRSIRNVGKGSVLEIKRRLATMGLTLEMIIDPEVFETYKFIPRCCR